MLGVHPSVEWEGDSRPRHMPRGHYYPCIQRNRNSNCRLGSSRQTSSGVLFRSFHEWEVSHWEAIGKLHAELCCGFRRREAARNGMLCQYEALSLIEVAVLSWCCRSSEGKATPKLYFSLAGCTLWPSFAIQTGYLVCL